MLQHKSPDGLRGPHPPPSSHSPRELGLSGPHIQHTAWAQSGLGLREDGVKLKKELEFLGQEPGSGLKEEHGSILGQAGLEKGWSFEMFSSGFRP